MEDLRCWGSSCDLGERLRSACLAGTLQVQQWPGAQASRTLAITSDIREHQLICCQCHHIARAFSLNSLSSMSRLWLSGIVDLPSVPSFPPEFSSTLKCLALLYVDPYLIM